VTEKPLPERKIIHIDMDAFFASVEQRDRPELSGKPVVVGGRPNSRGVVAAASYEARKFGVRSAMSSSRAQALCPSAIFVPPRFVVYQRVSRTVMGILRSFTDLVEPLSIDEAFLDVTRSKSQLRYASQIAKVIRQRIFDFTGLTASAGVAPNKFLAKIASDMNKPDGLTVIQPADVHALLESLPVRKIPGIGPVTEQKMAVRGVVRVGDLCRFSEEELVAFFGKQGRWFFEVSRGIDNRPVVPHRERKSISAENTFERDIVRVEELELRLSELAERVYKRCQKKVVSGRCVTLKVKYNDFEQITRSYTRKREVASVDELFEEQGVLPLQKPVRLLGIGVQLFEEERGEEAGERQLWLAL
jgi:DNA polymerase-4